MFAVKYVMKISLTLLIVQNMLLDVQINLQLFLRFINYRQTTKMHFTLQSNLHYLGIYSILRIRQILLEIKVTKLVNSGSHELVCYLLNQFFVLSHKNSFIFLRNKFEHVVQ